jgi:hypothetical protein
MAFMAARQADAGFAMIVNALGHAIQVQIDLLDHPDPRVRQAASIDLQDRAMGKSVARVAPTLPDGVTPYQPSELVLDEFRLERINQLLTLAHERKLAANGPLIRVLNAPLEGAEAQDTIEP